MDFNDLKIDDLLLTAIKSEVDSYNVYSKIAEKTQNGLLEDKLKFLAQEEQKHRMFIEKIFKEKFPDKKIVIPDKTVVPLPDINIDEDTAMSILLKQAMDAEENARDFYKKLAERFQDDSKIHNTLLYFSDMEVGHFKILEQEKESMERFEEADQYWPMIHAGP